MIDDHDIVRFALQTLINSNSGYHVINEQNKLAPGLHLSQREIEVLEKIGAGKTTKEIAFFLGLSPRTVDIHRANIKKKLGFKSSTEILAFALSRT